MILKEIQTEKILKVLKMFIKILFEKIYWKKFYLKKFYLKISNQLLI